MQKGIKVEINTSRFDAVFRKYMELTSKSLQDAINNKLFDITLHAGRETGKADPKTIRSTLKAVSSQYPNRTVAQMIVIAKARRAGQSIKDLESEANDLIRRRVKSVGFAKAGWIPGLKTLLPLVFKSSARVGANMYGVPKGGAQPVKHHTGNTWHSETWNDVRGNPPAPKIEDLKEKGAQAGIDWAVKDMVTYIEKNIGASCEFFTRTH